jgi:hypothetical protein
MPIDDREIAAVTPLAPEYLEIGTNRNFNGRFRQ